MTKSLGPFDIIVTEGQCRSNSSVGRINILGVTFLCFATLTFLWMTEDLFLRECSDGKNNPMSVIQASFSVVNG